MQALFEWDFRDQQKLQEIVSRGIELYKNEIDQEYIIKTVEGVKKNLAAIDEKILTVASEFPLDQIAMVDKAVLRIAIFEMLYDDQVPPKVAINEAVELAKLFGGENSFKFVNGVLGSLYRQSDRYDPKDELPYQAEEEKEDKIKSVSSEDIMPIEEIKPSVQEANDN